MVASNTHDCFREFLGQKLTGLLFGALPLGRADLSSGTKTLIFADGRGLTISSHGAYWIDSADEIHRAVMHRRREISQSLGELHLQLDEIPLALEGAATDGGGTTPEAREV